MINSCIEYPYIIKPYKAISSSENVHMMSILNLTADKRFIKVTISQS